MMDFTIEFGDLGIVIDILIGVALFSVGFLAGFWMNAYLTRRMLEREFKKLKL